uniref:Uncharacterized protein n=1 Tax=viral metagenome TaxID=1070528 RepID=A0A6C0JV39_9ZZZZ
MSLPSSANNVNASLAGVFNITSYQTRMQNTTVFCNATANPFCEYSFLLGGPCQKEVLQGFPTYINCFKPNMDTNRRLRQ